MRIIDPVIHKVFAIRLVIHFILFVLLGSTGLFSTTSLAAGVRVEAMQMPAWVIRAGVKQVLKPGMELNSADVINTGAGARMLLRLDEGSTIKMGENASLDLTNVLPPQFEQAPFEAAIHVIRGAFRFTTTVLGQNRKRNIDVRIGTVSAGIRGTDIWGSAQSDKDILCLIEGNISAQREGERTFTMQDPLSFYIAPKNKPALPVKPVPQKQLTQWATETEVANGKGVLRSDGAWAVNLMSLDNRAAAEPTVKLLAEAGYPAEIFSLSLQGREWFRVRVTGFASKDDALHFAAFIDGQFGIEKPWAVQF